MKIKEMRNELDLSNDKSLPDVLYPYPSEKVEDITSNGVYNPRSQLLSPSGVGPKQNENHNNIVVETVVDKPDVNASQSKGPAIDNIDVLSATNIYKTVCCSIKKRY